MKQRVFTPPASWQSWLSTGNLLIGFIVAAVASTFSLGVTCARAQDRMETFDSRVTNLDRRFSLLESLQAQRYSDLDRRLQAIQQQQTLTQNDVLWIRREFERAR